jgi:outer membrane protein OmpA-like peptidoglycan-associated protein/flagellar hook assembly protein FlgD
MKKNSIIFFIVFVISSIPLYSQSAESGKNIMLYGTSAASMGRGSTGVSVIDNELFFLNPASIGFAERWAIDLQYGGFNHNDLFVTTVIPTSYGSIGVNYRFLNLPSTIDFSRSHSLTLGAGKDITRGFLLGLSIDLNYIEMPSANKYFRMGFNLGAIHRLPETKSYGGFGIFKAQIGWNVKLGLSFGNQNEISNSNFNTITLGYSFQFFKHKNFTLGFFNDVSWNNFHLGVPPFKFGLESEIFKYFVIRAGAIAPNSYGYGDFTLGVGFKIDKETFAGTINYALVHSHDLNFIHYLSLKFEYGSVDKTAPKTKVMPGLHHISPNHDGTQDYVVFNIGIDDKSRIKGWSLKILDKENNLVKEFRKSEREIVTSLSFTGFFKRLVQKKESMTVPPNIMWDGTNIKGMTVSDSSYTYTFTAFDERENHAVTKKGTVFVDNTSPKVSIEVPHLLFSPNNDKKKDELIIKQNIQTSQEDIWKAEIKDAKGKIIKTYLWKGNLVPKTVTWNGKDNKGKTAPEGLYYYNIASTDKAGNKGSASAQEITLTRKYEIADVNLEKMFISFKNQKLMKFYPSISKKKGMKSWKIEIKDRNDSVVSIIQGKDSLPDIITWDGKNKKGISVLDGQYLVKFTASFSSGNQPSSFSKKLVIDSTPPQIRLSHSPDLFSPDNDGENDILNIRPFYHETSKIKKWKITITGPDQKIFKLFKGIGKIPEEIKWDGKSIKGELVESAENYYMILEASDIAGNYVKSKRIKVETDILVIVTEKGLKMRISNINFAAGSDRLKPRGIKILNRVYVILQKYKRYDVLVEGHTDDRGSDTYNQKLSERRAQSVMNFLVKKGMPGKRFTFEGKGETTTLYPNTSRENRRRNRRVEFLLVKQDR